MKRFGMMALVLFVGLQLGWSQSVSIPSLGTPVTQDFGGLANSGTAQTALPSGWLFVESGTNANSTYDAGTGSNNAGNTYSFGAAGSNERAFGGLQSGSLVPTIGASFTNNSGGTITSLAISYFGEQWRLGATGRTDRLDFQYSLNATSLTTGSWTDVNELDFNGPISAGTAGALDGNASANRTSISFTITGLNIAPGATFFIRWNSFDATGADDGLAVDDFSLTATGTGGGGTCPTITILPTSLPNGTSGVNYSQTFITSGGASPYTFSVQSGTPPSGLNLVGDTLSGLLTSASTFNFTIQATDSTSPTPCTGSRQYAVTVSAPVVLTNINRIQGSGVSSPLAGQSVITQGIVTGVRSNGFYIQNAAADYDADPLTSEAVLVFTSSAPPAAAAVGNRVQVTGTVTEFRPTTDTFTTPVTELTSPAVSLISTGNPLPAPVALDATVLTPGGGQEQLERFEHMRVSLPSMTVVAPTDGTVTESSATATTSGFFYAVFTGLPVPFREAGIQTPTPVVTCAAGSGCAIPIFDNNPERIEIDSDRLTGTTALNVRVGQVVTNVVGVLDWGFRVYQVYPDLTSTPLVSGTGSAEGIAPTPKASEVTVAAYNVERFFDTVDDPGVSDVVLSTTAFNNRVNKLALGIRNNLKSPDILALEEVDNLNALQAVATRLNTSAASQDQYQPFLIEGNDIGGIDVAFLVKNTVTVNSVTQLGKNDTYTSPCTNTQEILNDRPPLLLRATVTKNNRTMDLVVIVNHLRSLNDIDDETACTLSTNGARVRAKRAAQAEFLANLIQSEQIANPNVKLVSVGDMNAFDVNDGYVDVIGTVVGNPTPGTQVARASADLVNPNLLNLLDIIPDPSQRFSYVFDGNHQTLDHLLYTQSLTDQVTNGLYVRLNSEFPETDRNEPNSARRLSDHDPGMIYLTTAQRITAGLLVQRGGLILSQTTGTYNGNLFVRNTGTVALTGPFTIAISGLPSGVSLANATGASLQGSYIVNNAGTIAPGGFITVPVQFSNPGGVAINYTTKVYSGAF